MIQLDHIVVAADRLERGVEYVEDALGIKMPQAGGKHPLMATHNRLMSLGSGAYLEVIAIDPQASAPSRARWFDLDHFSGEPRLQTWVARVDSLETYQNLHLGALQKASRGNLEWLITIPEDGRLHLGGVVPYLIEWGRVHPTDSMLDSGCGLLELVAFHPEPQAVLGVWQALGLEGIRLEQSDAVRLEAHLQTPRGTKVLR